MSRRLFMPRLAPTGRPRPRLALALVFAVLHACGGSGGGDPSVPSTPTSPGTPTTPSPTVPVDVPGSNAVGASLTTIVGAGVTGSLADFGAPADNALVANAPWVSQLQTCGDWSKTKTCGPTTVAMAIASVSGASTVDVALLRQVVDETSGSWPCGNYTNIGQLSSALTKHGTENSVHVFDAASLLAAIKANHPVIAPVYTADIGSAAPRIDISGGNGHFMLIVGVTSTEIIANDPGRGTAANGAQRHFPLANFLTAWWQVGKWSGVEVIGSTATVAPPAAVTVAASNLSTTGATLNGGVLPNGSPTDVVFEWGPTTSYGQSTPAQSVGAGRNQLPVASAVAGLSSATTYHYRLMARSSAGVTYGADAAFTTSAAGSAPGVTTGDASAVGVNGATLNASVTANGLATTAQFEWGTSTAYGSTTSAQPVGSGTTATGINSVLSALLPGTTYHYRVLASNSVGKTTGADGVFTTAAVATPPVTLTVDGAASSARAPGQTFSFSGDGYAPNGSVTRYERQADGSRLTLTPALSADGNGRVEWSFPATCSTPVGSTTIWVVDDASGRLSNTVTRTVESSASCTPPSTSAPTITSFNPSAPQATRGSQTVTVLGTAFQTGLTVTVGFPGGGTATLSGTQIGAVTANSFPMQIDFNGNAGSYTIRVNNPYGRTSNTASLVVSAVSAPPVAAPTVTGFTPNSPQATKGNQTVTVLGTGFQAGLTVTVGFPGGGSATLSGSQIGTVTATSVPIQIDFNGNAGPYAIRVNNPGGQSSNTATLVVTAPPAAAPAITGFSPSSPQAARGNQTVTVQGTGFQAGLTVTVGFPGGGSATLSGTQIGTVTPTSVPVQIDFNGNAGSYTVRVNNPGGLSSNTAALVVSAPPAAAPAITGFSPSSPVATRGNQTVTVQGTGFEAGLTVTIGFPGGGSTTLSGAQIGAGSATSVPVQIDFNGNAGSYTVRVNNPGGQSSNVATLVVAAAPAAAPTVTGFSPSAPQATAGNQTVTVSGTGFQAGLTVTVGFPGGGSATLSGTQIGAVTATSFPMQINFNGNAGSYTIRVNNPGGQSSNTATLVVAPAPTAAPSISGFSPSSPQATRGNQTITVQGTGFQAGLTVTVGFPGGGSATLSGTQIGPVTPTSVPIQIDFNGNAGSYTIRVNNPGGQNSNSATLVVSAPPAAAPTITGFSPTGPQATRGNQTVSVFGTGFQTGLTVTIGFPGGGSATLSGTQIGGASASGFSMQIDFNGNAGTYTVRVNNPGGQSSNTASLVVTSAPAAAPTLSVSPASGTQKTNFTTSGSNFTPGGTVNRFVAQPGQAFVQIGALTATSSGTITWSFAGTCTQLLGTVQIYAVDVTTNRQTPVITEQIVRDPTC